MNGCTGREIDNPDVSVGWAMRVYGEDQTNLLPLTGLLRLPVSSAVNRHRRAAFLDNQLVIAAGFIERKLSLNEYLLAILRAEADATVLPFKHGGPDLGLLIFQGEMPELS